MTRALIVLVLAALPLCGQGSRISHLNNRHAMPGKGLVALYRLGGIDASTQPVGARWVERKRNLGWWSEALDDATWGKWKTTVSPNAASNPLNGEVTADKLIEDATAGVSHTLFWSMTGVSGITYTLSIYAKAGERTWIYLTLTDSAARVTWFNLATGATGTNAAGTIAAIESLSGGWYRVSISRAIDQASYQAVVGLASGNNVTTYNGDNASGAFLWGAQLTPGPVSGEYERTGANQVVWDYSGNGNHAQRGSSTAADANDPFFAVEGGQIVGMGFDGSNDYLIRATTPVVAQPMTWLTVHNITNFNNQRHLCDGDESTDRAIVYNKLTTGELSMYAGTLLEGTVASAGSYAAAVAIFQGATSRLFRNGTQIVSGNAGTRQLSGFVIGAGWDFTNQWLGTISTMALYSRALSDQEIARIQRLLKRVQPELGLP